MNIKFDQDVLWRTFRAIVASALAQTFVLQVDWNDPTKAVNTLWVSFVTGILMGTSKFLRENFEGKKSETTTGTVIHKLPV